MKQLFKSLLIIGMFFLAFPSYAKAAAYFRINPASEDLSVSVLSNPLMVQAFSDGVQINAFEFRILIPKSKFDQPNTANFTTTVPTGFVFDNPNGTLLTTDTTNWIIYLSGRATDPTNPVSLPAVTLFSFKVTPSTGAAGTTATISFNTNFTYMGKPDGSYITDLQRLGGTYNITGTGATNTPTPTGPAATNTPTPTGVAATNTPTPTGAAATNTPTPTGGQSATSTPTPGSTNFNFSIRLLGVWVTGTVTGMEVEGKVGTQAEKKPVSLSTTAATLPIYQGAVNFGLSGVDTITYLFPGFLKMVKPLNDARSGQILINGDVNGDNQINEADITKLNEKYNPVTPFPTRCDTAGCYDLNFDGVVNALDYSIAVSNYGATGDGGVPSPTATPIPTATPTRGAAS